MYFKGYHPYRYKANQACPACGEHKKGTLVLKVSPKKNVKRNINIPRFKLVCSMCKFFAPPIQTSENYSMKFGKRKKLAQQINDKQKGASDNTANSL